MKTLNQRELDVLNILHKTDVPMIATEIVNVGDGLTQSTVTAVLRKLLKEELVEVAGITHSGRVLSRTFQATEKSKRAILEHFMAQYSMSMDVIKPGEMCEVIKNMDVASGSSPRKE